MSVVGQAKVQKKYDALYSELSTFFHDSTSGKLTANSVTVLVRYSMELAQTGKSWKGMTGVEKKDLVLGVVTALVEDLMDDPKVVGDNFDEGAKAAILAALAMAPTIIDAAVDFAKKYKESKANGESGCFCC